MIDREKALEYAHRNGFVYDVPISDKKLKQFHDAAVKEDNPYHVTGKDFSKGSDFWKDPAECQPMPNTLMLDLRELASHGDHISFLFKLNMGPKHPPTPEAIEAHDKACEKWPLVKS